LLAEFELKRSKLVLHRGLVLARAMHGRAYTSPSATCFPGAALRKDWWDACIIVAH
jgi:hypothetical protein